MENQILTRQRHNGSGLGNGSNGKDVALNKDGTIVYAAGAAPYLFTKISVDTMSVEATLAADAYPAGIETGPNDELHGVIDNTNGPQDIWIYESNNSLRTVDYLSNHGTRIIDRALAVSGDGYVSIAITSDPRVVFFSSYP